MAETVQPPHYQKQHARIGKRCNECIKYVGGFCSKYRLTVNWDFFCDDWENDPDGPMEYL